MVYAQPRICPGEWDAQTLPGFWNTNGTPDYEQTTESYQIVPIVTGALVQSPKDW